MHAHERNMESNEFLVPVSEFKYKTVDAMICVAHPNAIHLTVPRSARSSD
jgi:hypothetical protein